jgi:hypothetical protein
MSNSTGHVSGGYGVGLGLKGANSSKIAVENSDFTNFDRGAFFLKVTDLAVRGNDMRLMSLDVLEFAEVDPCAHREQPPT